MKIVLQCEDFVAIFWKTRWKFPCTSDFRIKTNKSCSVLKYISFDILFDAPYTKKVDEYGEKIVNVSITPKEKNQLSKLYKCMSKAIKRIDGISQWKENFGVYTKLQWVPIASIQDDPKFSYLRHAIRPLIV